MVYLVEQEKQDEIAFDKLDKLDNDHLLSFFNEHLLVNDAFGGVGFDISFCNSSCSFFANSCCDVLAVSRRVTLLSRIVLISPNGKLGFNLVS